ncbi:MAG TPA: hypothetical protein VFS15_21285 [Kofleriaceae bacterium]|nr:hypothetical protein [Kofleriaceae bacterium]
MRPIPLVFALAACGGAVAESPLTIQLGLTHDQTEQALRQHQFCLKTSSAVIKQQQREQLYPRCERAASEHGDAWVIARYDGDRLVELRRYERYSDDNRAIERWNELITERTKTSPASDQALQQIKDKGLLQAGTRSVKAFDGAPGTVVGVYLLTPSPPDNANVLEQVTFGAQ